MLSNIHINDLEDAIPGLITLVLYLDVVVNTGESSTVQGVLDAVQYWARDNKMVLNAKKTKDMWINFRATCRHFSI